MKTDTLKIFLLTLATIALIVIAVRPYVAPDAALAQPSSPYPLYIEPGTKMLRAPDGSRQIYGRVVVDMRTGKIWGFPTFTSDTYPVDAMDTKPKTSHPFVLGQFAFEDTDK
jgi:hypothetical protein